MTDIAELIGKARGRVMHGNELRPLFNASQPRAGWAASDEIITELADALENTGAKSAAWDQLLALVKETYDTMPGGMINDVGVEHTRHTLVWVELKANELLAGILEAQQGASK